MVRKKSFTLILHFLFFSGILFCTGCAGENEKPLPNVVLIVMDTVRADHFSCYGYHRPTSPHVDRIASEGILFRNTFSPSAWTLPAHASLFSGLYPSRHAAHHEHQFLDSAIITWAEILEKHGYRTGGFSMNPHISTEKGFSQGFSCFFEAWKIQSNSEQKKAMRINREIKTWLETGRKGTGPFFLFINYLNAHIPYTPPASFYSPFLRGEDEIKKAQAYKKLGISFARAYNIGKATLDREGRYYLNALYDGEIAFVDMLIGDLYRYLETHDDLDNTLLIITSDHGENIGHHRLMDHQLCLYDSLLRVPLILRFPPRLPAGEKIDRHVELIDLLPAILEICGLPFEGDYHLDGTNLLNDREDFKKQFFLAEYFRHDKMKQRFEEDYPDFDFTPFYRRLKAIRRDGYKYIWSSDGRDELYHVKEDREETENLIDTFPDRASQMKNDLLKILETMTAVGPMENILPLDERTLKHLEALGYAE